MRDKSMKKANGVGFAGEDAPGDEDQPLSHEVVWVYDDWSDAVA